MSNRISQSQRRYDGSSNNGHTSTGEHRASRAERTRPGKLRRLVFVSLTGAALSACIGVYGQSANTGMGADTGKDWSVKGKGLVKSDGAFFTGAYRNVFAELGKPQSEIDEKIRRAHDTYFSTTDENTLYYEFGKDEAYVKDIAHEDIRSEGMSYAMMITVQLNDQAKFDKLWNFAIKRMRVNDPKHPSYRGFAWVVNTEGQICDENSAPDGEEYFAMALYFAHHRWGSKPGKAYNSYKYWADEVLDVMKNRPPKQGSRSRRNVTSDGSACVGAKITDQVTSSPLFDTNQKQIRFNATVGENFTDPSYHLPAFYHLFALLGPSKDAAFWNDAAATSRKFLERAMNPKTGLVSEYARYDGTPYVVSWNSNSGQFAFDSWRVGGNVGMDWAWMAQPGSKLRDRADALLSFFHSQGPTDYLALWKTDGTGESGHHSPGLIAMNAVATLATTDKVADKAKEIVEDFWNVELPKGKYRYYDGLLYMFGMLHLSGRYNIYAPQAAKPVTGASGASQAKGAASSGAVRAGTGARGAAEPGSGTVETTQPNATNPAATNPAATKSGVTSPAATKSGETSPAATNPAATNPAATNPAATNPAATNPGVTSSAATNPAAASVNTPAPIQGEHDDD